jgi:hypothetical protein
MLLRPGPVSNTERQREFRERNPGYYGRLHRKRKAEIEAHIAARKAAELALAEQQLPLFLPAPVEATPTATPVRLALPAPVEQVELIFPGLEAHRAKQRELVPVEAKQSNAA